LFVSIQIFFDASNKTPIFLIKTLTSIQQNKNIHIKKTNNYSRLYYSITKQHTNAYTQKNGNTQLLHTNCIETACQAGQDKQRKNNQSNLQVKSQTCQKSSNSGCVDVGSATSA
jgi:hypothetical protein